MAPRCRAGVLTTDEMLELFMFKGTEHNDPRARYEFLGDDAEWDKKEKEREREQREKEKAEEEKKAIDSARPRRMGWRRPADSDSDSFSAPDARPLPSIPMVRHRCRCPATAAAWAGYLQGAAGRSCAK